MSEVKDFGRSSAFSNNEGADFKQFLLEIRCPDVDRKNVDLKVMNAYKELLFEIARNRKGSFEDNLQDCYLALFTFVRWAEGNEDFNVNVTKDDFEQSLKDFIETQLSA